MNSPLLSLAVAALAAMSANAATAADAAEKIPVNPQRNAYYGELHLHTAMSFDAFLIGTRVFPDTGYRYARGEEVEVGGKKFRRKVPLDFCAVTDHSEYLGQMYVASQPGGPLANTVWARSIASEPAGTRLLRLFDLSNTFGSGGFEPPELLEPAQLKTNWQRQIDAAEHAYQPGRFTTFVA